MRNMRKRPWCHIQTGKVQMSMHIRAVWSGHSLFIDIYYNIHGFCKRSRKAQISLRKCAGWSGPALSANCIRGFFMCCASNTIYLKHFFFFFAIKKEVIFSLFVHKNILLGTHYKCSGFELQKKDNSLLNNKWKSTITKVHNQPHSCLCLIRASGCCQFLSPDLVNVNFYTTLIKIFYIVEDLSLFQYFGFGLALVSENWHLASPLARSCWYQSACKTLWEYS